MSSLLLSGALAFYLLTTAIFVAQIVTGHDAMRRVAYALLGCAFALHAGSLVARAAAVGYEVIASYRDELSFIACCMVGVYLFTASRARANLTVVGTLVTPIAFLLSLSAHAFGPSEAPPEAYKPTMWLPAHVAPAFLGYAVFAVAFCLSLAYLLQERQLKSKRMGDLFRRLPSLETLDTLNYRFVALGFALFTVAIVTGSLLARHVWGHLWSWEPVQVLSVLTWLLYACLLQARSIGWRGRKAATLTIAGFVLVLASFLTVNLLLPGKHPGAAG